MEYLNKIEHMFAFAVYLCYNVNRLIDESVEAVCLKIESGPVHRQPGR